MSGISFYMRAVTETLVIDIPSGPGVSRHRAARLAFQFITTDTVNSCFNQVVCSSSHLLSNGYIRAQSV